MKTFQPLINEWQQEENAIQEKINIYNEHNLEFERRHWIDIKERLQRRTFTLEYIINGLDEI